jgi:hypothetical protein
MTMHKSVSTIVLSLSLGALLAACGGETETPEVAPEPAPTEEPTAAPATPDDPGLDIDALNEAENVALVPSPVETQKALEAAGIDTQLASLIPKHTFDLANADTDHAALRTGVVLADSLLTVKTAEKETLLGRLDQIRQGMSQLGGGKDIDATLQDMRDRVKTDAVDREELLKEFDELSGAVIPELKFNDNERVVPLIEAGSWLEGANLVAKAVKDSPDTGAADTLLKQPAVVDYFIDYVREEGSAKAPATVTEKLEASLKTLKELASKADPLSAEDIATVIQVTDDVLALL